MVLLVLFTKDSLLYLYNSTKGFVQFFDIVLPLDREIFSVWLWLS